MKKLIISLVLLVAFSSMSLATDTFRVIRDGDLIKTTAPIITGLTGTAVLTSATVTSMNFTTTASATLTTGNINIPVRVGAVTYYIKANTGQ